MRALWIKIHLYIAAFFSPMLLMMAASGGLYLLGIKGTVEKTPVEVMIMQPIDIKAETLKQDVDGLLQANGVVHVFEYVKVSGKTLITRPTSEPYYEINIGESPAITYVEPDLVKQLVELHKGHGPGIFKNLQKIMAAGLLIVLLSGLWLGLSSQPLMRQTVGISGAGLVVFVLAGFIL